MTYDFKEQLNASNGVELEQCVLLAVMKMIPRSIRIDKSTVTDDRSGVDYWIVRNGLDPVSVDAKHRATRRYGGDLCIEWVSVYRGGRPYTKDGIVKIGWTLDTRKRTDIILYTWPTDDSRRIWRAYYFPWLCKAARDLLPRWRVEYGVNEAQNDGYSTLNVFVPTDVVEAAIANVCRP